MFKELVKTQQTYTLFFGNFWRMLLISLVLVGFGILFGALAGILTVTVSALMLVLFVPMGIFLIGTWWGMQIGMVSNVLTQQKLFISETFRAVRKRVFPILGMMSWTFLIFALLMILLSVPAGIVLGGIFGFTPEASAAPSMLEMIPFLFVSIIAGVILCHYLFGWYFVVFDEMKVFEALEEAKKLVQGRRLAIITGLVLATVPSWFSALFLGTLSTTYPWAQGLDGLVSLIFMNLSVVYCLLHYWEYKQVQQPEGA
ncbi:MAG: hypothetical protein H6908_04835 [Hyphomicrobiales bacterium]|nr:hypothetical protein [Hyphomicrobiales bacterium]